MVVYEMFDMILHLAAWLYQKSRWILVQVAFPVVFVGLYIPSILVMFTNLAILWDPYLVGRHFNGKIINKSQSNSFPLPGRQEEEIKTSKIQ